MHLLNGADRREDLSGRAVAALKPIAVKEGGLHRVQLIACGEALYRGYRLPLARPCQRQTRQDALAFDDDRARAARALVAALLGADETEHVVERIQQRDAWIHRELVSRVVHTKRCSHAVTFGHERCVYAAARAALLRKASESLLT